MKATGFAVLTTAALLCACAKTENDALMFRLTSLPEQDGGCIATIDGKSFDPQDIAAMESALAPYADSGRDVRIVGDGNVPYRCIGGVIYTMQRQGHKKVGFVSEPSASSKE